MISKNQRTAINIGLPFLVICGYLLFEFLWHHLWYEGTVIPLMVYYVFKFFIDLLGVFFDF